jgi:Holliday junction resolvase RusA-like endonuclease
VGLIQIIIPGRFSGLNEFIKANRTQSGRWNAGNSMKHKDQQRICQYLPVVRFKRKIFIEYVFYEPNTRRDKDNISGYFHKIFQDAMVQAGLLENDGWKQIDGWSDYFKIDQRDPRIEVYIEECKK